jgi:WD40 repeat protein
MGTPLPGIIEGSDDLHDYFAVSPNGRILAASRSQSPQDEARSYVSLRNIRTQKLLLKVPSFASTVAFSPDGKTFVTSGRRGGVRLRDVASGAPAGPLLMGPPEYLPYLPPGVDPKTKTRNELRAVAFSADGEVLAAGEDDAKIYLWDVPSGAALGEPLRMPNRILASPNDDDYGRILGRSIEAIAFSPDGSELVASDGTSVVLWRTSDRSKIATLPLNDPFGRVNTLAFSPDGRTLATGQGDGTLRFWNTSSWEEVGVGVKVASEAVLAVAFDPSGTMLVTAGDDSSVRLIDVATRTEIGQAFPGIAGPPAFAAFTPDGSHIIAGNVANHLYEWDVDPTDWAAHACEVAGRNFTPAEWNAYLPGRPYQAVCPAAVN